MVEEKLAADQDRPALPGGQVSPEAPADQGTCKCGKAKTPGAKRCHDCQSDATRMSRALKSLGGDMAERWRDAINTGGIDGEEFKKLASGKLPKEIAKMMEFRIEETFADECTLEMVGTGDFLDEEDMTEKYKNKPKRLAVILKNANRYYCDIAETEYIEDMTYKSRKSLVQKRSHKETCAASGEQKVKKVK
eukprot:9334578-Pyramimonas_sp.AAC.1